MNNEMINASNMALHKFLINNNSGRGINNGCCLYLKNRTIFVLKDDVVIGRYNTTISICNHIPSLNLYLGIEDDKIVETLFQKAFLWPTKYFFEYSDGILSFDFNDKKIKIF